MKKKRVLVSNAPIMKAKNGETIHDSYREPEYFAAEYMNEDGVLCTAEFNTKEEAEHFIIMFEYNASIDYQNSCREYFAKERKYFTPSASNVVVEIKKEATPDNEFRTILSSIGDVLTEKNKRYGNSALNPIEVFNGKSKVGQRADDKLSRIQNSEALRKNDVCDLIGYLVLMCKENNWLNFADQID